MGVVSIAISLEKGAAQSTDRQEEGRGFSDGRWDRMSAEYALTQSRAYQLGYRAGRECAREAANHDRPVRGSGVSLPDY